MKKIYALFVLLYFSSKIQNFAQTSCTNKALKTLSDNTGTSRVGVAMSGLGLFEGSGPNSISNNLTLEAWINPISFSPNIWQGTIISTEYNDGTDNYGYVLRCGDGGKLDFVVASALNTPGNWVNYTSQNAVLTANVWQHVAVAISPVTGIKMYVNGIEVPIAGSSTYSAWKPSTEGGLTIATSNGFFNRNFNGEIDNVKVWNVTRTQNQINAFKSNTLCNANGLLLFYKFDDASLASITNHAPVYTNNFGVDLQNGTNASNSLTQTCTGIALTPRFGMAAITASNNSCVGSKYKLETNVTEVATNFAWTANTIGGTVSSSNTSTTFGIPAATGIAQYNLLLSDSFGCSKTLTQSVPVLAGIQKFDVSPATTAMCLSNVIDYQSLTLSGSTNFIEYFLIDNATGARVNNVVYNANGGIPITFSGISNVGVYGVEASYLNGTCVLGMSGTTTVTTATATFAQTAADAYIDINTSGPIEIIDLSGCKAFGIIKLGPTLSNFEIESIYANLKFESDSLPKYSPRIVKLSNGFALGSKANLRKAAFVKDNEITLYFSQADFTQYNAVNMIKLPTGSTETATNLAVQKANLKLSMVENESFLINANGKQNGNKKALLAVETINPDDNDITWDGEKWVVKFMGSIDASYGLFAQQTPLPLNLLEFKAKNNTNATTLYWETSSEKNMLNFDIQKSSNGIEFNSVGMVKANNFGDKNKYTFNDSKTNDIQYYRLKMNELDGSYSYSQIVKVQGDFSKNLLVVYPNPVQNELNLQWQIAPTTTQKYAIYNSTGVLIKTVETPLQKIDTSKMTSGTYFIRTENQQLLKFVKQ
jgi:hypothetical protein